MPLEETVVVCDCERDDVMLCDKVEQVLGEDVGDALIESVEHEVGEAVGDRAGVAEPLKLPLEETVVVCDCEWVDEMLCDAVEQLEREAVGDVLMDCVEQEEGEGVIDKSGERE